MVYHKRHGKRSKPSNAFLHTALAVMLAAIVVFAIQQRGFSRGSSYVTLVKRDQSATSLYSENDLKRLETLLVTQPENPDVPKAIRALKVKLFQDWLKSSDNDAIRLDPRSVDHKGIFANKRLRSGQTLARISLDRILTADMILKTEIGAKLSSLNPSVHVIVGTYIALQRYNSSSEIYPYLRILPEKMDFMPALVPLEALDSLNGTSAQEIVIQRKIEIDDEWIRISPIFPALSVDDFLWGICVSMTRTSAIIINNIKTAGLIPLLNDFRHAPSTVADTAAKIVNGYYVISTTRVVEAGTELTRSYGKRSAQMFYCDYANVPAALSSADSIRLQFLPVQYAVPEIGDIIGIWPRNFLLTSDLGSKSLRQCLAFLRLRVATEDEWKMAQMLTNDLSHISFINDANERRAIDELSRTLANMINSLNCSAPDVIPADASMSILFAIDQARHMCSLEKNLAQTILDSIPRLYSESKALPIRSESSPTGDPYSDAKSWMIDGGANMDAIDIASFGDSFRGLVAKSNIAKGQTVMMVPLSHCVTSIAARRTALAHEAARNNVTLTAHAMMAALLVQESRNPQSHFQPFLRTLPASYDNFLIYYSEDELKLLKGTRTLAQFKPHAKEIDEDFEIIRQAAPIASASMTFEEYRRARHAVDSRNFIFRADGFQKEHILVPYVDMMNHGLAPNTDWTFDVHTATFVVTAHLPIAAGGALVTTYGDKSNAQLLIGYGFALPNNPFDKATLRLNKESMCVVQKTFNTIEMADCFLKLRKKFTSEIELLQQMKEGAISGLARFDESIEEDQAYAEQLLKQPETGNDRVRFCILTRLGEKLVLKFWIETITTLLQYYAGEITRDQLDPIFEQYFKVLENPQDYGSKVRGKTDSENADN